MKEVTIEINVIGRANTGKTTIAEEIYRTLSDQGFDVKVEGEREPHHPPHYERMKALKEVASVTIKQTQTNREPEPCKGCGVPFGDLHQPGCDYDLDA